VRGPTICCFSELGRTTTPVNSLPYFRGGSRRAMNGGCKTVSRYLGILQNIQYGVEIYSTVLHNTGYARSYVVRRG
jgi:hypothetical protein